MGGCHIQRHRGGWHAQPFWVCREEGLGSQLRSGSWPRPRASIYRAITSFSERKYWVSKGRRRRPTAPDSPEKSVPALALVGDSDEGVHGSHAQPRVAPAPSWVLWDVAGPGGQRIQISSQVGGTSSLRPHGGRHTFGNAAFRVPVRTGSGSYQGDAKPQDL